MKIALAAAVAAIGLSSASFAEIRHQPKGHIDNASGKGCTFVQTSGRDQYFHSVPGQSATLVFDDPRCMSAQGVDRIVNVRSINYRISRVYSHSDAKFMTREDELFGSSPLQVRGKCIQSKTYPMIGVAVEYFERDGYITKVRHASTIAGCKE